jgi:hypothetical protein
MRYILISAALVAGALVIGCGVSLASDFNVGFGANTNATAQDVGLPVYPGARPHRDKQDDDSAAKVWGMFGSFGLKVAAVKLESGDPPAKVASYYFSAMGRYGRVLDCSPGKPRPPRAGKNSQALDCGDDQAKPGGTLFKVGMKNNFRAVSVEPYGRGSTIEMAFVDIRGAD